VLRPKINKIITFIDKLYIDSGKNLRQPKPDIRLISDTTVSISYSERYSRYKDLHDMKISLLDIFDRATPLLKDNLKELINTDTSKLLLSYSKYNTEYYFNNIIAEDMKKYLEKIKVN
jgi:hypothetical protein